MIKGFASAVSGLALALSATAASASLVTATISYDFSASEHFGATLTGELHDQGTATTSDDFIDGITQLTAQFNGQSMRGPLFFGAYDHTGRRDDLAARLYLVIGGPNPGFIIDNCGSSAACAAAASASDYNFFFARRFNDPEVQFVDISPGQPTVSAGGALQSLNISLAPATSVPEPESLSLIGAALMAGAAITRRRKIATAIAS